jgi:hypothetical protein
MVDRGIPPAAAGNVFVDRDHAVTGGHAEILQLIRYLTKTQQQKL